MRASSLILFVGLSACAASVRATVGDASPDVSVDAAPVDVAPDVPSSACAWSVGAVRDLVVADDASCELIDAIPGAWVLRGCVMRDGRPSLNLTRFDEATGATNELRYEFDSASFEGLTDAALAADRALGRGVIVVSAGLGRRLIGFDGAGAPSAGGIITDRTGGFSLDAWRSPVVRADGYAFIADQVRALWGTSLAFTDRNGFATRATDLGVSPEAPATVSRFMLDGGAFALGWFVPRTSGPQTLVARAYSDEGVPRGAAVTVGPLATTSRYAIRGDAEGLVAVWEDAVDTLPPLTGVAFRALAPDGSARGEPAVLSSFGFYGGALDAAITHGDVLVSAISGSGVLRLAVLPVSRSGVARGTPISVSMVDPLGPARSRSRVIATPGGALVAFQRTREVVSVATLTCAR